MIRRLIRRLITARRLLTLALAATVALLLLGANLAVVAWVAIAEFGLYLAILNGLESLADLQSLGGHRNGRRTIAIGNFRREVVRGLIALDFITIGLLVLLDYRGVVVPGLILGSVGMALNSYLDRRDRLYLMVNGMQPRDESGKFRKDG